MSSNMIEKQAWKKHRDQTAQAIRDVRKTLRYCDCQSCETEIFEAEQKFIFPAFIGFVCFVFLVFLVIGSCTKLLPGTEINIGSAHVQP